MNEEKPFRRVEVDKPDVAHMSRRRAVAQSRPLTDDDIRGQFEAYLKLAREGRVRGMALVFELDPAAEPSTAFYCCGTEKTREGTLLGAVTELLNFAVVEFEHVPNDEVSRALDRCARAAVKQILKERS